MAPDEPIAPDSTLPDRYTVGSVHPPILRAIFVLVGLAGCFVVLWDLGRALWPLSVLTLFFGIIVVGGVSVCLSFVLFGLAVPDMVFVVEPGRIVVTARLGRVVERRFEASDIAWGTVMAHHWDSGPDTYGLRIKLKPHAEQSLKDFNFRFGISLLSWLSRFPLFRQRADFQNGFLISPSFANKAAAEAALHLLDVPDRPDDSNPD